jgi:peptidoglycan glycosyltransferase
LPGISLWQTSLAGRLERMNAAFLIMIGVVALALVNWSVIRAPALLAREDNPRLVEAELRVQRGRILDRNGVVLAQTVGEPGALVREYHLPTAPTVGYYSLRYGVSGVEAAYDEVLRGRPDSGWNEWWNGVLHRHPVGRDVQLTLDANLQEAAEAALGDLQGAAVLLEARSGEILALVSHPGYDPNLLDEQFDILSSDESSPLLDRTTHALYQPGAALQPLVLAAALDRELVRLHDVVTDPGAPVSINGVQVECAAAPSPAEPTVAAALSHACPALAADLAARLGPEGFVQGLADLGLFDPPQLSIPLRPAGAPAVAAGEEALLAEAVGQGALRLSPMQMAQAVAAIANDGQVPALRLLRRVGSDDDGWEIVAPGGGQVAEGVSSDTAAAVVTAMSAAVDASAPRGAQVASHLGVAVSGPGGVQNTWFLGFAPAEAPRPSARYVVVVLLEGLSDRDIAAAIGRAILAPANA